MTRKIYTQTIFTIALFFALTGCTFLTVLAQDDLPPTSKVARVMDFDGDNATDLTVVRDVGIDQFWYIGLSGGGSKVQKWGINNDWYVPEYYDSDNKADIAVWRQGDYYNPQGNFYILRSTNGTFQQIPWGLWMDTPEKTADFDGDNLADPTVVRFPAGGKVTWYSLLSTTGQARVSTLGVTASGDGPIRGDFDGDGRSDLAVRRCVGGQNNFIIKPSSTGFAYTVPFGQCGPGLDMTVSGDFDGDGKTDVATYRWNAALWRYKRSSNGAIVSITFGLPGSDLPAPGDYDGDGKTDLAIFRNAGSGVPSNFHVLGSTQGYFVKQWGLGDDHIVAFDLYTH